MSDNPFIEKNQIITQAKIRTGVDIKSKISKDMSIEQIRAIIEEIDPIPLQNRITKIHQNIDGIKSYARYRYMENNEIVAIGLNSYIDFKVSLKTFKELVNLDLVRGYSLDQNNELIGAPLLELNESHFEMSSFFNEHKTLKESLVSLEHAVYHIENTINDTEKDKIDKRFIWGDHISIICDQCGAKFHTKNITRIGARTIFDDSMQSAECKCDFSKLRILTESELNGGKD